MPLVRYEIRNEYSLANPQLYRNAPKDDPEALLEGVAMAGLVGIVRQLGDLAEFAAEIFRDLHEEVMATAARGHELLARVQQLEAEVPAVEKALLSETNQLRFAYTQGAEWHASMRNDQNHCTQGDLPRFIRNSYEECRGPPRLFLLDKFDGAGAGACLKRYTDPSFFKTEWASSELMKAERAQRDKKARREKKKGRRRKLEGKEPIPVDQLQRFSRELASGLSKELNSIDQAHSRMWRSSLPEKAETLSEKTTVTNSFESLGNTPKHAADTRVLSDGSASLNKEIIKSVFEPPLTTARNPVGSMYHTFNSQPGTLQMSTRDEPMSLRNGRIDQTGQPKDMIGKLVDHPGVTDAVDDSASDYDHFVDALATMEPEVDSDSEPKARHGSGADFDRFPENKGASPLQQSFPVQAAFKEDSSLPPWKSERYMPKSSTLHERTTAEASMSNNSSEVVASESEHVAKDGPHPSSPSCLKEDNQSSKFSEEYESFISLPEPSIPLQSQKGAPLSYDLGAVSSFHGAATLNKIVAEFERLSSEQADGIELQTELGTPSLSTLSESLAESGGNPTACMQVISPEDASGSISMEGSPGVPSADPPRLVSPQTYSPPLQRSPSPPRINLGISSPLRSHKSLDSGGSLPGSPIFSALHSPLSPVRASHMYFSSPDSLQRLSLSSELLIPSSPTAVNMFAGSLNSPDPLPPPLPPLEWLGIRTSQNVPSPKFGSPSARAAGTPRLEHLEIQDNRSLSNLSSLSPRNSLLTSLKLTVDASPREPEPPLQDHIIQSPPPDTDPSPLSEIDNDVNLSTPSRILSDSILSPTSKSPIEPAPSAPPSRPPPSPPRVLVEAVAENPPAAATTSGVETTSTVSPSPISTSHELPPPPPPPLAKNLHELPPPPLPSRPLYTLAPQLPPRRAVSGEVQDALLDAITSHDKSMLKKVKTMQNPTRPPGDGFDVLLQQIRAQSFNLRHTAVEKKPEAPPRPVTNINVAAILEKANAIRQAFAGSDEDEDDDDDDDWSDV